MLWIGTNCYEFKNEYVEDTRMRCINNCRSVEDTTRYSRLNLNKRMHKCKINATSVPKLMHCWIDSSKFCFFRSNLSLVKWRYCNMLIRAPRFTSFGKPVCNLGWNQSPVKAHASSIALHKHSLHENLNDLISPLISDLSFSFLCSGRPFDHVHVTLSRHSL